MYKETLSTRIKVTDDTTVSRLSLIDQIKLLIAQLSHPEAERLRGQQQALRRHAMDRTATRKALVEVCEELLKTDQKFITIKMKSSYMQYIDEFTDSVTGYGAAFNFIITDRPEDPSLDYDIYVRIEKKEG